MPHLNLRYATQYKCVKCKSVLTQNQRMYSNGRCPFCGYKAPNACTIVACNEMAVLVTDKSVSLMPKPIITITISLLALGFISGLLNAIYIEARDIRRKIADTSTRHQCPKRRDIGN